MDCRYSHNIVEYKSREEILTLPICSKLPFKRFCTICNNMEGWASKRTPAKFVLVIERYSCVCGKCTFQVFL